MLMILRCTSCQKLIFFFHDLFIFCTNNCIDVPSIESCRFIFRKRCLVFGPNPSTQSFFGSAKDDSYLVQSHQLSRSLDQQKASRHDSTFVWMSVKIRANFCVTTLLVHCRPDHDDNDNMNRHQKFSRLISLVPLVDKDHVSQGVFVPCRLTRRQNEPCQMDNHFLSRNYHPCLHHRYYSSAGTSTSVSVSPTSWLVMLLPVRCSPSAAYGDLS